MWVFCKIQDICYEMGTEIFKIEQEMTEKRKPELPTLPKNFFYSNKQECKFALRLVFNHRDGAMLGTNIEMWNVNCLQFEKC